MSGTTNAKINDDGGIIMGNLFCADGHDFEREFFAISHMHSDHASLLTKCLYQGPVYMTNPTRKLLEAINDDSYSEKTENGKIGRNMIRTLEYGEKREVAGKDGIKETISFHHSNHTLGASQIEINTNNSETVVYSGDITKHDIPPSDINTLIVDATHGHPRYEKYPDEESLERQLLDKIEEVTQSENPQHVVIHGHEGKIQEAMTLLSCHKPLNGFPFVARPKDIRVAKVYRESEEFKALREEKPTENGICGIITANSSEFEDMLDGDSETFIEFTPACYKKPYETKGKAFSVYLTDKCDQESSINEEKNSFMLVTSAHAAHSELIDYVKRAEPNYTIVDNYRSKQGVNLTNALKQNGFAVEYQPK